MHLMLVGNYGVGNLGDELMKEYFLREFPSVSWSVVSANPTSDEFFRLPCGFWSFFTPWLKTVKQIRKSDGLVFGGGTLFTDTESVHACIIWWIHAFSAKVFRKKIYFTFQGIGPFRSSLSLNITRSALKMASYISVRDQASESRVRELGLNVPIVRAFDPIISLLQEDGSSVNKENTIALIPRAQSGSEFTQAAKDILTQKNWEKVYILSFQPENDEEKEYIRLLQIELGVRAIVIHAATFNDVTSVLQDVTTVLSHRFHGSLIAYMLHKDVIPVSQAQSDKHQQLVKEMQSISLCRDLYEVGVKSLRKIIETT